MKGQDEQTAENYCNAKAAVGGSLGAQEKRQDPKEIFLHRIDIAEENLVRQLSALKELRNTIRWASPEALTILEKVVQSEHLWR